MPLGIVLKGIPTVREVSHLTFSSQRVTVHYILCNRFPANIWLQVKLSFPLHFSPRMAKVFRSFSLARRLVQDFNRPRLSGVLSLPRR